MDGSSLLALSFVLLAALLAWLLRHTMHATRNTLATTILCVGAALVAARHIALAPPAATTVNVLTLLAEFAIAVVIYYEIEQNRAAGFLAEALGPAYKAREEIYSAYTQTQGANNEERTKAFCARLKTDATLRRLCDLQFAEFCRAQYMMRRSLLHHNLLVTWFPQVLARLWMMLGPYLQEKQAHKAWHSALRRLFQASFVVLERQGIDELTVYSGDGSSEVVFCKGDLRRGAAQLREYAAA